MTALSAAGLPGAAATLFPGVLACGVVAAAATFLSQHYGAPVMLFALLLGMAMNFLSAEGPCAPGIEFTARQVLRIGVALLGLRITVGADRRARLAAGAAGRRVGGADDRRVDAGGAAAGLPGPVRPADAAAPPRSAAPRRRWRLSAALPAHPLKERATLFTVIGVCALSTLAMIVYPMIAAALGLDAAQPASSSAPPIHDVAQVVGAGYSMSQETGDVATFVKLMRVAMLLPVIVFAVMLTRPAPRRRQGDRRRAPPAAAAVVRGRLRGAGGDQQHRLGAAACC